VNKEQWKIVFEKVREEALGRPLTMQEIQRASRKYVQIAPDLKVVTGWLSRNATKVGHGQCQVTGMRATLWQI
jgi:hypothetical protein